MERVFFCFSLSAHPIINSKRFILDRKKAAELETSSHSAQQLLIRIPDLPALVSVDVETAGPIPSQYPLLSIGACMVANPMDGFYVELQPEILNADVEALAISGLNLEDLTDRGVPPKAALELFEVWLAEHIPPNDKPIFVAFNAAFDWMFLNDYFHRYLGRNPFGHFALDIKAFYMGLSAVRLSDTSFRKVSAIYLGNRQLTHNALADARDQAEVFYKLLLESAERQK